MIRRAGYSLISVMLIGGCQAPKVEEPAGRVEAPIVSKVPYKDLKGFTLTKNAEIRSIQGLAPNSRALAIENFSQWVSAHKNGSTEEGEPELTTIGRLRAEGRFKGTYLADGNQVLVLSARGNFKKDQVHKSKVYSASFSRLTAMYDPATGEPLGVAFD